MELNWRISADTAAFYIKSVERFVFYSPGIRQKPMKCNGTKENIPGLGIKVAGWLLNYQEIEVKQFCLANYLYEGAPYAVLVQSPAPKSLLEGLCSALHYTLNCRT